MTIISIVFGICCAILFVIGLCLGWSYEESSVYVCISFWPYFMTYLLSLPSLYSIAMLFNARNVLMKLFNAAVALVFTIPTYMAFKMSMIMNGYYISKCNDNTKAMFDLCVKDLTEIAHRTGMSYYEVNIIVYCYSSLIILLIVLLVLFVIRLSNNIMLKTINIKKMT